eukprot:14932822-Alexandrium_andersonii.AAC.1
MSASLVGSEMCIRDRASMRLRSDLPAASAARGLAPGRPSNVRNNVATVSYTHLTLPTICSV